MRTFELTTDRGDGLEVSEQIFIYRNELYRLVRFCRSEKIGYHWDPKLFFATPLSCCNDGIPDPNNVTFPAGIYIGIKKSECKPFNTHPLNEKR